MKMYEKLAEFYDDLVKDNQATKDWVSFVKRHFQGTDVLEVACGSGEITIALAKEGYKVTAGDISLEMMDHAKQKTGADLVSWQLLDMRDLSNFKKFSCICCFCDSLNYLIGDEDVQMFFRQAYDHLYENGVLLFDMHSLDRLCEFEEEFCETGVLRNVPYEWMIFSEDDCIYQNFAFYYSDQAASLEQHVQRVYDPKWIEQILIKTGFTVEVFTDFDRHGIQEGEKYFYVCRKQ